MAEGSDRIPFPASQAEWQNVIDQVPGATLVSWTGGDEDLGFRTRTVLEFANARALEGLFVVFKQKLTLLQDTQGKWTVTFVPQVPRVTGADADTRKLWTALWGPVTWTFAFTPPGQKTTERTVAPRRPRRPPAPGELDPFVVTPVALTAPEPRTILRDKPTMKHPKVRLLAAHLLLVCAFAGAQPAAPEPDQLPSWVLFGLGQKAYEQKHFGEATVYFRRAVDRKGLYPEAEAALAKIANQGEGLALQEVQLQKALDERGLLQVPDDRYALLYALADLRLRADSGTSVEKGEAALETWREILRDDTAYRAVEESGGLDGYYNALMARPSVVVLKTAQGPSITENMVGLNRLLYLYRHPLGFSLRAHQEIAALSVTNKAYKKAVGHSLFALVGIFSSVIDQVKVFTPDYSFRTLDELFTDSSSPVYLGKPPGMGPTSNQAGGPNPGWLIRYQPVWDYLRGAGTLRSLNTLLAALDGLAAQEKTLGTPAGQRPVGQIVSEVRRWRTLLFPDSEVKVRG